MRTYRIEYEKAGEDERFRQLANRCWGYVPLETGIVFAVENDMGVLIATGEFGQLESDLKTVLFFSDSVHPDYRRQGLQTALIYERIEYARELESRRCVATTYGPDSISARNYQRAGFVKRPWIPDGPAEHQTEWVLDL